MIIENGSVFVPHAHIKLEFEEIDDKKPIDEEVYIGDIITCSHFYEGKVTTHTGKVKFINLKSGYLVIDASEEYTSKEVKVGIKNIVDFAKISSEVEDKIIDNFETKILDKEY